MKRKGRYDGRQLEDRALEVFKLIDCPIGVWRLTKEVNDLREDGEPILSVKQIGDVRSKLRRNGTIKVAGGMNNTETGKFYKLYALADRPDPVKDEQPLGLSDKLWETARKHDERKEINAKVAVEKQKQLDKEDTTIDIDKLEQTFEDFKEVMTDLLALVKYTKEMESAMKFWMNEAKKAGIRWGVSKTIGG